MFACITQLLERLKLRRWGSMSRREAAEIIELFLIGKEDHRFSNFLDYKVEDPLLGEIQAELNDIEREYPSRPGCNEYCNPEGIHRIRSLLTKLRSTPS